MVQVGRKPCMLLPFIGHTFIAGVLIINIISIILIILIIAAIMNIKTNSWTNDDHQGAGV